jgi:hypothetical protein
MEEWRIIPGCNYQVSSLGRVMNSSGHLLAFGRDGCGYLQFNIYQEGKRRTLKVHKAVALAFLENPDNKATIDHINRINTDNRVCNLRWASHSEQNYNSVRANKSGYKFIRKRGSLWSCYIIKNQHKTFDTLEEAIQYRDKVLAQNTTDES